MEEGVQIPEHVGPGMGSLGRSVQASHEREGTASTF